MVGCHCLAQSAHAAAFCAVTLNVTGFHGRPISSTWIELSDRSGKAVLKEMMVNPQFKICDFGFGPHTLKVGTNECLPVTISNLRLVIGKPLTLNVVLSACGYLEKTRNACLLYVRVVDERGSPVEGAQFSPWYSDPIPETDSFGRYQGLFIGTYDVKFVAPGFESTAAHFQCRGTDEVDQKVVMRRVPHPR
jgi:hypothetical protein